MSKGGTGMDILVFFAAALLLVVYGVWKHSKAEDNDYAKLLRVVGEVKIENAELRKLIEGTKEEPGGLVAAVSKLNDRVVVSETTVAALAKDNEASQEHMARLRKGQIDLRDRSYPRTVELKVTTPTGPIPIEVWTNPKSNPKAPTQPKPGAPKAPPKASPEAKKMLKKVKKQMDRLNQ